ncbi:uncharacterized protein LOC116300228 [Actinia tenebrosa]|uniref:Uncharacterized protein LOC116300228 n=1 Tax=Actinia tenebrosa TaxID=6105 RepID=A0A6P8I8M7_ACTTE|nr:uncharacterized protein LOC116300228 [Actinia tenebrosa]XP_031564914.1 uncharacterized protein LOC116300228 [Actinia tenebrosa]
MLAPADVVAEAREHSVNLCSIGTVTQLCAQVPAETRDSNCKGRMKSLLLLIGFMCIVSCFVFASMGYIELKSCPPGSKEPDTNNCKEDSSQFKLAQNYRLSAALLFILGICIIVVFIWMVKKDNRGQQYVVRTDVVVSDVTEEGLLKTPAPELPHPRSQLHRIVYEEISESSQNDLPHYESALKLNKETNQRRPSVTCSCEMLSLKGVVMESVSVQVDEDDINPPPSYSQALLHEVDEGQENLEERENLEGQNHEELDNG